MDAPIPQRPKLRAVEAFPLPNENGQRMFGLRDQTGIAEHMLSISAGALQIMALMDGTRTLAEIRVDFARQTGLLIEPGAVERLAAALDEAMFLEGEAFESRYRSLADAYRAGPTRIMRNIEGLGLTGGDGDGAFLSQMLAEVPAAEVPAAKLAAPAGRLRGLIAPHLDYPRGRPCYAAAYAALRDRPPPQRVVILGTNHFGRSSSVVATGLDFATPLGTSPADVAFLERLEACLGGLRTYEMDHAREHSVELQVLWLQHLFGAEGFRLVPFLCPNPCGPTGTAPHDGHGVDLREFALALGEAVRTDGGDTLIVAGADLSHVGAHFGDDRPLSEDFLREVRRRDGQAIAAVTANDAEAFRETVARDDNPTRVCSAGCIYALMTALSDAEVRVLGYHQAVHREAQCTVTCMAAAFFDPKQRSPVGG